MWCFCELIETKVGLHAAENNKADNTGRLNQTRCPWTITTSSTNGCFVWLANVQNCKGFSRLLKIHILRLVSVADMHLMKEALFQRCLKHAPCFSAAFKLRCVPDTQSSAHSEEITGNGAINGRPALRTYRTYVKLLYLCY